MNCLPRARPELDVHGASTARGWCEKAAWLKWLHCSAEALHICTCETAIWYIGTYENSRVRRIVQGM
jgi:hypothetical protein